MNERIPGASYRVDSTDLSGEGQQVVGKPLIDCKERTAEGKSELNVISSVEDKV
jgi:hypothetical protein